jgi:DNA-binding transcriptional ArsR family regulator
MTPRRPAPVPGTLARAVDAAKALGHPVRLRILSMLADASPLCVCQMTSVLELAASTVSGHLTDLRRAGLVVEEKSGKLVFYRLEKGSEAADLVRRALALVAEDEQVSQDRGLIRQVRGVPVDVLTRASLRLDRIGIKRPSRAVPA